MTEREKLTKRLAQLRLRLEIATEAFDYEGLEQLQEEIDDIVYMLEKFEDLDIE